MTANDERIQAKWLLQGIESLLKPLKRKVRYMEVCGTHTVAIFRAGLRQMLPDYVELVSGPGCPVCVTPESYMDLAITYARRSDVIIATFGDMLKVPGSESSLEREQAAGADIRVVYSPLDSLVIANENPDKYVVFLAVGFETTAPAEAATVIAAREAGVANLLTLSAQKLVPPALKMLLEERECRPDGFLLPGHVAVVTGTKPFAFVADKYGVPGVVAGFEPLEILRAVYELAKMTALGEAAVVNEYKSVVFESGNEQAQKMLDDVYEVTDAEWRGLGILGDSGLRLKKEYAAYDAERQLPVFARGIAKISACRCGDVLKGRIIPPECPLFAKACVPTDAKGPCMVSVEGVCAAWYKYGEGRFRYGRR